MLQKLLQCQILFLKGLDDMRRLSHTYNHQREFHKRNGCRFDLADVEGSLVRKSLKCGR